MKTGLSDDSAKLRFTFFCCVILIAFLSVAAKAASIFDDNWTPPPRKTPANPNSTPAPRSPVDPQPAAQPARRPIPGKLEQARSRNNLNQVFGPDMQDTSIAGRRKLAAALFDAVPKTADNPVDQYVLLGGAINAAREGCSLRRCVQTAEFLSQMFDVDGTAIKADAALNMNLHGGSRADTADNAAVGLEVLDLLIAEEDFASAARLSGLLRGLAPAVPSLAPIIQQKAKELDVLRLEHDRFVQQSEILKTKPDDPAANLAVGKYYCFGREEWPRGLPYLAKGSDADLKKAANDELTGATSATENELLGDGWWAAGEKQVEPIRGVVREHAVSFYNAALGAATGLERIKMQHRVAEFGAAPAAPVAKTGHPPDIGDLAQTAVVFGKAGADALEKTIGHTQGDPFIETAPTGMTLVGFEFTSDKVHGTLIVKSARAIYRGVAGEALGHQLGSPHGDVTRIIARDGYGVGAIEGGCGLHHITRLTLHFVRIKGNAAIPGDAYNAPIFGTTANGSSTITADKPVIGIHGSCGSDLDAIGLTAAPANLPVAASTVPQPGAPRLSNGPVLHYRLDKEHVTTISGQQLVKDLSATEADGALRDITFVDDPSFGSVAEFNGATSKIECPASPKLQFASAITVGATVLFTAPNRTSDWADLVAREDWEGGPCRGFALRFHNETPDFQVGVDGWKDAGVPNPINLHRWCFVAGTFDGQRVRLFLDGKQVAEKEAIGNVAASRYPLLIGNCPFDAKRRFAGKVKDVFIFDRALSPEEISDLEKSPLPAVSHHESLASATFAEDMGYSVGEMRKGVSLRTNDDYPLTEFPASLAGKAFTRMVGGKNGGVTFRFTTKGRVFILAQVWPGYAPQAAQLKNIATKEPMRVQDSKMDYEVWSITAETGKQFFIPFQVILVADSLEKVKKLPE